MWNDDGDPPFGAQRSLSLGNLGFSKAGRNGFVMDDFTSSRKSFVDARFAGPQGIGK